jgi:hypothetical protein
LCVIHHTQFERTLHELASLVTMLERDPLQRASGAGDGPKVQTSGFADLSSLWNPKASQALVDVAEWTSYLVRKVLQDSPLPKPKPRTVVRTVHSFDRDGRRVDERRRMTLHLDHFHALTAETRTSLALAALSQHYARWLTSAPGPDLGPGLLNDARMFARGAVSAMEISPIRRVMVRNATCQQTIIDPLFGELTCSAPMVGILDSEARRPSELVCSTHPDTHVKYSADQWMELVADAG